MINALNPIFRCGFRYSIRPTKLNNGFNQWFCWFDADNLLPTRLFIIVINFSFTNSTQSHKHTMEQNHLRHLFSLWQTHKIHKIYVYILCVQYTVHNIYIVWMNVDWNRWSFKIVCYQIYWHFFFFSSSYFACSICNFLKDVLLLDRWVERLFLVIFPISYKL